jgi:hypothetical protein
MSWKGNNGGARAPFTPLRDGCKTGFTEVDSSTVASYNTFNSSRAKVSSVDLLRKTITMSSGIEPKLLAVEPFVVVFKSVRIRSRNNSIIVKVILVLIAKVILQVVITEWPERIKTTRRSRVVRYETRNSVVHL